MRTQFFQEEKQHQSTATIVKATLAHEKILIELGVKTYQETYPTYYQNQNDIDRVFETQTHNDLLNPDILILLLAENNHFVGYAKLDWNGTITSRVKALEDTPFLDKLYILKSHQRKGYGKKLLLSMMNIVRERQGAEAKMNLLVFTEEVQKFYEKFGFVLMQGVTVPYYYASGERGGKGDQVMVCTQFPKELLLLAAQNQENIICSP